MSQHDYVIANQSGSAFRADLNNALAATVTGNSGSSAPSTTYAYMIWNDTTSNQRKIRNSANNAWIVLSTLSGGNVFDDDVTFNGASYNLVWDKSDNALEFADNAKATFGAPDLEIYHDGNNSRIVDSGTGNLILQGSRIVLNNADSSENMVTAEENGAVELFYGGTKKLNTTSYGAFVNGRLSLDDDDKITLGDSMDLQISHDGNSIITNTTGDLYLQNADSNSNQIYIRAKGGTNSIIVNGEGSIQLYHNNAEKLNTSSSGVTVHGTVNETSDIALKTNIKPIDNVLNKIQQITGYQYQFKETCHNSMGVTAQDVEKVFPELVHGEEGEKTLQYSGLIGALVESVKELSAKVAALEAK